MVHSISKYASITVTTDTLFVHKTAASPSLALGIAVIARPLTITEKVNKLGTSAKIDYPKEYLGRRACAFLKWLKVVKSPLSTFRLHVNT